MTYEYWYDRLHDLMWHIMWRPYDSFADYARRSEAIELIAKWDAGEIAGRLEEISLRLYLNARRVLLGEIVTLRNIRLALPTAAHRALLALETAPPAELFVLSIATAVWLIDDLLRLPTLLDIAAIERVLQNIFVLKYVDFHDPSSYTCHIGPSPNKAIAAPPFGPHGSWGLQMDLRTPKAGIQSWVTMQIPIPEPKMDQIAVIMLLNPHDSENILYVSASLATSDFPHDTMTGFTLYPDVDAQTLLSLHSEHVQPLRIPAVPPADIHNLWLPWGWHSSFNLRRYLDIYALGMPQAYEHPSIAILPLETFTKNTLQIGVLDNGGPNERLSISHVLVLEAGFPRYLGVPLDPAYTRTEAIRRWITAPTIKLTRGR